MTDVVGYSGNGDPGVAGFTDNGIGVSGVAIGGHGLYGFSKAGLGVFGGTDSGIGVNGRNLSKGDPTNRLGQYVGVYGTSYRDAGVYGRSDHVGVCGLGAAGVYGVSGSGAGVYGQSYNDDGIAVVGFGGLGKAGLFSGDIDVYGNLTVINGNKPFQIDHPLDPQNKYLLHHSVESSDRMNVYDGVAHLDEDGSAWVDLPEWFEALNGDFRYQLTAVGGAAPQLHVAEEITENRFKIAGGQGGMKVCWQLTGTRKDAWAAANPFEVEQEKPQEQRGRYLQPDLYDAPEEQRATIAPQEERLRQMRPQEPQQPPQFPVPPEEPMPQAPQMPPGFGPFDIIRQQREHQRQIDELKGQIKELKRRRKRK